MNDRTDVQRTAAVNFLLREVEKHPELPIERLFAHAAAYAGANTDQVRRWWAGRTR